MEFEELKKRLESKKLSDTIIVKDLIDMMSDIQFEIHMGEKIKSQEQEIKKLQNELFNSEENEQ